jgi:predicted transcriptional regulator
LNQGDLAAVLGRERSGISKLESGLVSLDMKDAAKLADLFGCGIEAIVYGLSDAPLTENVRTDIAPSDRISLLITRAQIAVSQKVGFSVSPEQALEFMARKADIHSVMFSPFHSPKPNKD